MKATRLILGVLAGVAVLAAGAIGAWQWDVRSRSFFTDADRIHVAASEAPIRRILWQPAEPIAAMEGARADEYEPRVSRDGSLLVFVRGRAGANADLYSRKRTPQGWSAAEPIAAINTEHDELGPELSPDGCALYFYSDRPGGLGGYDIWVSRATPDGWGEPVNLGAAVNSSANEYGPALTPDGKRLYFSSNRPRPGEPGAQRDAWPATIREQRARHDYDLYRSDLDGTGASDAAAVTELNTTWDEGAPAISPVGDFLYFASDRPGGLGGFDIYRARILRGRLTAPENLGPAVNSAANDLDAALSMDGFRLYFSSDRPGPAPAVSSQPPAAGPAAGTPKTEPDRYALWVSGSREVFSEVGPVQAGLLAQLWAAAWPWLLLLLLIALLALLLFAALRDATMRRRLAQLSLMAKCLLVSMLIHAGILALMAVWRVGNAIGDIMRPAGGTRVSLGSVGSGGIAAQIRSSVSTGGVQTPAVELSRLSMPSPQIAAPTLALSAPAAPLLLPAAHPPVILSDSRPMDAAPPLVASPPSLSITSNVQARPPLAQTPDAPTSEAHSTPIADTHFTGLRASPASEEVQSTQVSIAPAAADIPQVPSQAPSLPSVESSSTSHGSLPTQSAAAFDSPNSAVTPKLPQTAAASSPSEPTPMTSTGPALPVGLRAAQTASAGPQVSRVSLQPAPSAIPDIGPSGPPTLQEASTAPTPPSAAAGTPVSLSPACAPEARLPGLSTQTAEVTQGEPRPEAAPDQLDISTPAAGGRFQPSISDAPLGAGTMVHLAPAPGKPGDIPRSDHSSGAASIPDAPSHATASAPSAGRIDLPAAGTPGLASRLPSVPDEPAKPIESFAQRAPEVRAQVLEKSGGSQETEHAVALALEWFKSHQEPDGRWSGRRFDDRCGRCGGEAEIDSDASMTGMALLCFLAAGHTHTADGPHRDAVRKALTWIVDREDSFGDLRRGETMYSQTIASVALCEAYAMTRDQWLEGPARRAVTFVARGPSSQPGRPGRSSVSDTSVLGWQIMAIKSAERCGFSVPSTAFDAAARWLDQVSNSSGRYAYRPGDAPNAAATAEAMFVQQLLGHTRDESRMRDSAQFILATPPSWRHGAPTYHWYYATLALFQQQGEPWRRWNAAVSKELIANQRQDGPAAGSWDPQDQWSKLGGRIYQTAVCTLSLQVYYRYKPAEGPPAP